MSKIKIFFQIKPLNIEDNRKVLELEGKGREIVYGGRKGNILRMQECPGKKCCLGLEERTLGNLTHLGFNKFQLCV